MAGLKIYRNIYVKWAKIPYQKLSGRNTLLYTGTVRYDVLTKPKTFDEDNDYYFNCDCQLSSWKELKKVFI